MAKTIDELFRIAGVEMKPGHYSGREYYKCPSCSHNRQGVNRNSRCLAVNVDALGIRLYCNHCEDPSVHRALLLEDAMKQQGGQSSGGQGRSISERAAPKRNGYADLHRAGRATWARR